MSISANIPALGNRITSDVPNLNSLIQSILKLDLVDVTDLPVQAKMLSEGADGWEFQQYNGSAFVRMEKWNIDAQKVDGFSASQSVAAGTIAVRDAEGRLPGDLTGNAATASSAVTLSEVLSLGLGGTGGTTAAAARSNLGVPPTNHASSMTNYGIGTTSVFGHVKSHDEADSTLTASGGHAASPKALADVKAAIESAASAKYLPLTGGTVTGTLIFTTPYTIRNATSSSYTYVLGGTERIDGASLMLAGKDDSDNGAFKLRAHDGTTEKMLRGQADGSLTWGGNNVLTSAGGTVTGQTKFGLSSVESSAVLAVAGKYHGFVTKLVADPSYADWHVQNSNGYAIGNFRWCDTDENIRSEWSVQATEEGVPWPGNITLSFDKATQAFSARISGSEILTSAGGTLNGELKSTVEGVISRNDSTAAIRISGGTSWTDGASLVLCGKEESSRPGWFRLKANDGTNGNDTILHGSPDGKLTWGENPVLTLTASWHDDAGNWYRKYSDGWIEQGGQIPATSSYANPTLSLHTPFSDTNYFAIAGNGMTGNSNVDRGNFIYGKTTTTFGVRNALSDGGVGRWYACGF